MLKHHLLICSSLVIQLRAGGRWLCLDQFVMSSSLWGSAWAAHYCSLLTICHYIGWAELTSWPAQCQAHSDHWSLDTSVHQRDNMWTSLIHQHWFSYSDLLQWSKGQWFKSIGVTNLNIEWSWEAYILYQRLKIDFFKLQNHRHTSSLTYMYVYKDMGDCFIQVT